MRYEDTSGSVSNSGTPEARDDADALATGSNGPATGNVISGAGTLTGKAGEDTAANGHVVAIRGAGGTDTSDNGQSLHVDGRYGALVIDEHGNYKYVADGRAPADFRDLFQYTLADSKGGRSVADLVITRGAELKVADNAQHIVPGPDGVVTLPAGVDLNDVHVVGRDLVVTLPDGSQIVIVDGAVFVPQLVLGGVEVPSTNLAALLIDAEPKPAAGNTQSSGGNFDVPVPPLDPGVPLGDLIPPTELVFTPPEIKEIGQFVDRHPDAGTVTVQLDDDALPGGNPGGVGDTADNVNSSGFLPGSGGDGSLTWDLSDGGAPVGFSYVDGPNGSILVMQGAVQVLTITIDPDTGAYTVTQNAPILHAPGGDENNAAFVINYTVTDADGDTALGTLNINVNDDTPTVNVVAGSDANVNLTTHDAATIGAGSEAVSTSANFGGVFSGSTSSPGADGAGVGGSSGYALSTTGGLSGLTEHGVAINLYNVGGVIVGSTSTTAGGIDASNTVFSVSVDGNGVVTLTQFGQIDHTNTDPSPTGAPFDDQGISLADGAITLTRNVTVVDKDGDSVTGSAAVGIGANLHFLDDGPTIHQADHGEPTLVVDETDLGTNATASFAANFTASFGADGPAANSITYALGISAAGANSGLLDTATGQAIVLVQNGAVVEGHVGDAAGALAFTVSVNAAGDVTLDQLRAVVHPDGTNPDTDESVTLSADNLVTLTATAHDFDGDTASSTINIGTNLVFHDDGPTAAIGTTGQTVSLDETVGVQGDSNDVTGPLAVFAGVANKGVDPDMATQFAANVNAVVNSTGTVFGADGAGTAVFGLNVSSAGVDSGLNTTDGHDILLTLENGIVVGRVSGGADDGKAAFAISIDSSGHISMVEWLSIQHPNTGNPDDSVSIANGAVLATVTATDGDGDSSTASTAIGGLISFQDDGPTAAVGTTGSGVSLDETVGVQGDSNDVTGPLAQFAGVANKGVDPDMATQFAANASATITSTGTLFGADGPGTAAFSLSVSSAGVDSGLNTTDGHDIVLTLENGIVVGRVVGGADDGKAAFAISIDSTGHLSMVEWLSIQHPNTGNPDDSLSIANGAVLANITATDGDGDTSTASTAIGSLISFQDDGPTAAVGTTGTGVSLDETVGVQGDSNDVTGPLAQFAGVANKGVDPDMATQFAANATATVTSTGTLFGSDGPGTAVLSLNVSSAGVDSGLNTTDGHDILLTLENGVVVGRVSGGADDGKAAFAISIDSTGHLSMVEWLSIQHPNTGNPDDSVSIANGAIVAVVTATDGDGDTSTASTAIGSLISFQDDGPSINVTATSDVGVLVQTQDHDTIGAATDTASSSANFGGIFGLTSSGGSDGAVTTPTLGYTLGVPGAGANGVDSGLDQTGANIYLYTVGGVVVGSTSATLAGVNAGNTVFNVSVSGTGVVTLTQFSQIDHPIAGDPSPTGTPFADHILSMADGLITLTATASITDGDGDTATDSETVGIGANLQFADDGPIATNDTDSIVGGNGPATGNVITGVDIVGGDTNTTDGNADSIGADTPGTITKIQSVNVGANVDTTYDASHNLVVNGQYGTLTINEDGSYSYLRTSAVGGVSDVFTYTLTDRDGDTSTATLTIGIEDKFPVAGNIDAVVDDDDVIGANGNPGGVGDVAPSNATGNLPGSGGDGSLTWDLLATGAPAGFTYADGPNGSINVFQDGNANPVMNITINTATGAYTITELQPILHPSLDGVAGDNTENNVSFTINYTVTDADGDPASGTLHISVNDDTPTVNVTQGSDAGVNLTTHDALTIGAASDTASSSANFGGVFGLTQSAGADGTNTPATLAYVLGVSSSGVDSGLDQGGANIFLYTIGGKVVGSTSATVGGVTAGNTVFDVSVSGTGVVTLTQYSQIDHPIGSDPTPTGTPFADHIVSMVDSLVTLTASATLTDKDGDTATDSETVNIGANLHFADDGPTAAVGTTGTGVSLDETVGVQGDSNDVAGPLAQFAGVANKGVDPDMVTQFAANASATVNSTGTLFGADGPGTAAFSLSVSSAGVDSGLNTTDGHDILLTLENGLVVGRVSGGADNGKAAFAISIDSTGHLSMVEWLSIQHPITTNPDDSLSIANGAVLAVVTATDSDGDTSTASTGIGSLISFQDDGPTLGTVQSQQTDNNPATAPAVGTLHFAAGSDGAGSAMTITADVTGITSGGHALVTHQVGNVLTAYQDVGPAGFDAGDTTVVFTITVNPTAGTSGQYVFDLVTPLDPTVTDVPIGGSSAFGAGPTGFQVLDSASAEHLSVLTGYHTTATFNEATWLSTGSLTSAMIADAGINGSTNGWGVDNNIFSGTNELMFFDFGSQALSDPDGAGGIDPGSSGATLPDISIATYSLIGYTAADDISYVVHYTDGTINSGHIPSANMASGDWVFTADPGKFIGDIQLFTSGAGPGKIDLVSVGVQSTNLDKSIAASVTLTDGDGDPTTTGNFTIHIATGLVPAAPAAPVVLDLNGDGVHFLDAAAGVTYDYGHGAVATAWASPQDGILVNDANHNGTVDNASEFVFGSGSVTDLQALAAFDTNHDGQLSSADANFANFAVWQDANSNGVADAGEVQTLTARGITSISLTTDGIAYAAAGGDVQVAGTGTYTRTDGSVRSLADAAFQTGANSGANAALLGAIAAAGLAVDASATAAGHASVTAGLMATTAAAAHSQAFSPESLGSVSESHTSDLLALHNDAHDAAQGQNASARAADVANSNASLDSAKASADHGPTELLAGTQAPAHDQAGSNGGAAMPAAAQIAGFAAGGNAQHAQVVGQILADALHGGANGATIDHVLSALPGNGGGADAALAALASHGAEAVPNGDSNVFANFTMGHAAFTMEAMMVHVDAAPTHA